MRVTPTSTGSRDTGLLKPGCPGPSPAWVSEKTRTPSRLLDSTRISPSARRTGTMASGYWCVSDFLEPKERVVNRELLSKSCLLHMAETLKHAIESKTLRLSCTVRANFSLWTIDLTETFLFRTRRHVVFLVRKCVCRRFQINPLIYYNKTPPDRVLMN